MVSRRLWFPNDELNADRVGQAQKMLGDAFKGVKDAAGTAQKTVQQQFEEDRLGWAQKQMEQAFSNLRQAPQPEPLPEPEPVVAEPTSPPPMDAAPSAPSAPAMGQVHFGPTPGVDTPDEGPSTSVEPLPLGQSPGPGGPTGVTPLGPASTTPTDGAMQPLGMTDRLGQAKDLLGETFQGIRDNVGGAASDLGTRVNDIGFRAPGTDGKGILGNTGLGAAVRGADQWSRDVTPTPKSLSEPTGLLGEQGPLMKSLNPDVGSDPNLAGLKLGLETSGLPSQAKGAVRTGRDWMQSLDTLGTGLDKVTGADSSAQERGQGAVEAGMGAIGAFAPQFTYIGNVAAERAKELGYDQDKAETIGAVVGFLTPGGGAEQLGKAGAYLNRTQDAASALGRLGGQAENLARVTGNIGESAADLAKVGRFRSLAPAAAMGVAAPIGGVLGARTAAEKDGATAGDIALGGLGGAFRAADIAGGVSEMGLGAGAKGIGALGRVREAIRDGATDGAALNRIVPPEVVASLPYETKLPDDPKIMEALRGAVEANGGRITERGIEMGLTRHQKQTQPGLEASGLGGVYYHPGVTQPGDSPLDRSQYQRATDSNELGSEGGSQRIEGPTILKRPLIQMQGDDNFYERLDQEAGVTPEQRGALREMWDALDRYSTRKQRMNPEFINPYLERAGLPGLPEGVPYQTTMGHEWLGQFVTNNLARRAGYDSRFRLHPAGEYVSGRPYPASMEETIDLRERRFPTPEGGFSVRPEYTDGAAVEQGMEGLSETPIKPEVKDYPGRSDLLKRIAALKASNEAAGLGPPSKSAQLKAAMAPNGMFGIAPQVPTGLKLDAAGEVLGGLAGAQLTSQGPLADQMIDEDDPNAGLKRAGLGALGFAMGSQAGGALRKNLGTVQRVGRALAGDEAGSLRLGGDDANLGVRKAGYWSGDLDGRKVEVVKEDTGTERGYGDKGWRAYVDGKPVTDFPRKTQKEALEVARATMKAEPPPRESLPEGYSVDTINLRGGKQGYIVYSPNKGNVLAGASVRHAPTEAEAVARAQAIISGQPDPGNAPVEAAPAKPKRTRAAKVADAPAEPEDIRDQPMTEQQIAQEEEAGLEYLRQEAQAEAKAHDAEAEQADYERRQAQPAEEEDDLAQFAGEEGAPSAPKEPKVSEAVAAQQEAVAEAAAINEQGGTGQGATNPMVRATGENSPGNLPKIRQRPGNPAGGPHTSEWDEATMGTKPTSEWDAEDVDVPSIEALAAREVPITMADAQAIMRRQAAEVRRDGLAFESLEGKVPAGDPALAYLKKKWQAAKATLPYRQQAVRELAQANARAKGDVAVGLETNVQREANRVDRRQVNREARDAEDRAVVLGEGQEGTAEGVEGEGASTDVAAAVEEAGGKVEDTEGGPRVVDAEGRVVASRGPEEVDQDGKPYTPTPPAENPAIDTPEAGQAAAAASIRKVGAPTTQDLTPEGGVAPGGVIEAGGEVRAGATVGEGATIGEGADIGQGANIRPGAVIRPGATAAPGMLRAPVHATTVTTTTTTPGTPGVPPITTTTGSATGTPKTPKAGTGTAGSGTGTGKGRGAGTGKGSGTPKTPPTPPAPQVVAPDPHIADTGWFNEKGRLKTIDQLEDSVRKELVDDFNRWQSFKKRYDAAGGNQVTQSQVQADYEAAVGKMKAQKAAAISGMSEQDVLDLASKQISIRALMARAEASGLVGKNNDYAAEDFLTNYARANLIGMNPLTMARNAMGGVVSVVWHPIEAATASAIDPIVGWRYARSGLDTKNDKRYGKEVGYLLDGYWRALPAAIINMGAAMKQGQAYTARGLEEQLGNQVKGGNRVTTGMRQLTDQVLKPLTATDAFFRTLTQGGEVMRQSYRQMKASGMSEAQINAEQIKLLQGPRAGYVAKLGELNTKDLAKGVQEQMDYRALGQGLKEEDYLGRFLQQVQRMPGGSLIMPFVTTPYNAAKYDMERSPIGFAKALKDFAMPPDEQVKVMGSVGRRMTAKIEDKTISRGELSDRLARGFVGSALFGGLVTATMNGAIDVNGALPDSQDERDEWEAQGRKPYTIKIADRYVSFQDVPGLNASLTLAATWKDVANKYGDQDKALPEIAVRGILETIRSLAAQPMAGGVLDFAQSLGRPGGDLTGLANSMATPLLIGSGTARTVTSAMDKMQREQPKTAGEILSAPYVRGNLPVRHTAYGEEMGNQNWGPLAGLNPLRTSGAGKFEAPTRYVTSDNAATDVAIGRSKAKVDAWKKDPGNMPMPDSQDFVNAQLATAAVDPYTAFLRSEESTRATSETATRKSKGMQEWLAEPVRR